MRLGEWRCLGREQVRLAWEMIRVWRAVKWERMR